MFLVRFDHVARAIARDCLYAAIKSLRYFGAIQRIKTRVAR
jgi:hypothetical protein